MENKQSRILIIVFSVIFTLLFLRLLQLQVFEGGKYQRLAVENAAKTVPLAAPRGIIYDRNGQVLVENRPVFAVQVMPYLLPTDPVEKEKVRDKLSYLLGGEIEFKASASQPVIIKDNVKLETVLRIDEQKNDLVGVVVSNRPARFYPNGNVAAHLLGYVGEIEADELKRLKVEGYRRGDILGKDGVEKVYDGRIRGRDGGNKIEVDVYGTPVRLLESIDPLPGADVKLTLDLKLQEAAERALKGKAGAVVIIDPNRGEILALASRPGYDSNLVWKALAGGRHPFMNRALAIYPPGSIFKVITLSAALEEHLTKPGESIYCPGYYKINNRIAKCWKESGHGRITVAEGLTQSCDVVFYELGRRLGPERLAKYAARYGLGEKTGIDLPQEKKGLVPTEKWKQRVRGEPWYEGDSINYGIGQGFVQVTPLQMALVYGTIATGKRMRPYLVSEIKSRSGEILYRANPGEMARAPVSAENLAVIRSALREVVRRGTGIAAKVEGRMAAGKTGTAQNPGLPHAWFLCYAPFDDPKIVIAAFVEHGEHGDRSAAYVARDILEFDSAR